MLANRMIMKAAAGAKGNDDYTKLLMHMDGTDDSQIFTDSSVGNLVKTGDAMVGTGYGVFDGTGDYLSIPDHADWQLGGGSGDFTVEFWLCLSNVTNAQQIVGQWLSGGGTDRSWAFVWNNSSSPRLYFQGRDAGSAIFNLTMDDGATGLPTINTWCHMAGVRNGSTVKLYIDGIERVSQSSVTGTLNDSDFVLLIGAGDDGSVDQPMSGYIDELRISNTARYTGTMIDSTSNGSLEDEDCSNITGWTEGDSGTGDSTQATFDGQETFKLDTGNNLTSAASIVKTLGSINGLGNRVVISIKLYHDLIGLTTATDMFRFQILRDDWQLYVFWGTDGLFVQNASTMPEIGTNLVEMDTWQEWTFDVTFPGGVVADAVCDIYLDNVLVASDVDCDQTGTYTGLDGRCTLTEISYGSTTNLITYVDYFKVGSASVDETVFTPSRAPFTSDANTKLLIHFDLPETDPTVFEDSGPSDHTITANGNVFQKQDETGIIGTSCGCFDGTGDYLSIPDHADWDFGSGNFCVEAWIYMNDISRHQIIYSQDAGDGNNWFILWFNASIGLGAYSESSGSTWINFNQGNTTGWAANTWYHVALVRNGNEWDLYRDGISLANTTDSDDYPDFGALFYVGYSAGWGGTDFDGYIDEFRVTKGEARYTANFTPPTTAFTSDANTKLLLHFDGGEGSTSFTDSGNTGHTVTANGNAIQVIGHGANAVGNVKTENTQKKFGETSAYFDGTGDYITLPASSDFAFGSGDFTIDCWIRTNNLTNSSGILSAGDGASTDGACLHIKSNKIRYLIAVSSASPVDISSTANISVNTWYHVAVVKNGTTYKIYLDGVEGDSDVWTTDYPDWSADLAVGIRTGSIAFNGYIDELRISKGIARWTENFTPPSAPYS